MMIQLQYPFGTEHPVTQRFGENPGNYSRRCLADGSHNGVDFGGELGDGVLAAADGVVILAGWDKTGYGNHVRIQHNQEGVTFYTLYAHLDKINVKQGMAVKSGGLIGQLGSTGNSTGPHLHFEVRMQEGCNSAVDPMLYLEGNTQPGPSLTPCGGLRSPCRGTAEGGEVLKPGPHVVTTALLNVRHAPAGMDIGDLLEGETVQVLEGQPVEANGHTWYPVAWKGWVAGEWLVESRTPQGE